MPHATDTPLPVDFQSCHRQDCQPCRQCADPSFLRQVARQNPHRIRPKGAQTKNTIAVATKVFPCRPATASTLPKSSMQRRGRAPQHRSRSTSLKEDNPTANALYPAAPPLCVVSDLIRPATSPDLAKMSQNLGAMPWQPKTIPDVNMPPSTSQ
jgi:hypothetical protein